jgi:hypothetical protein
MTKGERKKGTYVSYQTEHRNGLLSLRLLLLKTKQPPTGDTLSSSNIAQSPVGETITAAPTFAAPPLITHGYIPPPLLQPHEHPSSPCVAHYTQISITRTFSALNLLTLPHPAAHHPTSSPPYTQPSSPAQTFSHFHQSYPDCPATQSLPLLRNVRRRRIYCRIF